MLKRCNHKLQVFLIHADFGQNESKMQCEGSYLKKNSGGGGKHAPHTPQEDGGVLS